MGYLIAWRNKLECAIQPNPKVKKKKKEKKRKEKRTSTSMKKEPEFLKLKRRGLGRQIKRELEKEGSNNW